MGHFYYIGILCLLLECQTSFGQQAAHPMGNVPLNLGQEFPLFLSNIQGRNYNEMTIEGVEGSPFLYDHWLNGSVYFKHKGFIKEVPLKFDLFSNSLFFRKNDVLLEFVDTVKSFSIRVPGETGDSMSWWFTNGFPVIGNNTAATFYKVVAPGKFQILSLLKKEIKETINYSRPPGKQFAFVEKFYVTYIKNGQTKMVLLKKAKKEQLDRLIKENGYALDNDKDISQLISFVEK